MRPSTGTRPARTRNGKPCGSCGPTAPPTRYLDAEDETARLRQDLELDSLDFLRLIETIAQATGVDTPERDYGQVATVQGLVDYVAAHG